MALVAKTPQAPVGQREHREGRSRTAGTPRAAPVVPAAAGHPAAKHPTVRPAEHHILGHTTG